MVAIILSLLIGIVLGWTAHRMLIEPKYIEIRPAAPMDTSKLPQLGELPFDGQFQIITPEYYQKLKMKLDHEKESQSQ